MWAAFHQNAVFERPRLALVGVADHKARNVRWIGRCARPLDACREGSATASDQPGVFDDLDKGVWCHVVNRPAESGVFAIPRERLWIFGIYSSQQHQRTAADDGAVRFGCMAEKFCGAGDWSMGDFVLPALAD